MEPFAPREIRWLGRGEMLGFAIKMYSINVRREPIEKERFTAAFPLLLGALPAPAMAPGRPGVAITIFHQGQGVDYVILAWWDRENELPLRVFVSEHGGHDWRPAQGSESVCVWDLEVLWRERELYVAQVMTGAGATGEYADSPIAAAIRDLP
ncbi:MAG: hypothetical protein V4558_06765 [Gemmatimonadota bacterium]